VLGAVLDETVVVEALSVVADAVADHP